MIVQYNTHAWCQISIWINTRSLKKGLTFNIKIFHIRHNHNLTIFVAFMDPVKEFNILKHNLFMNIL